VFDVLILEGRDVMPEPLSVRREVLRTCILPKLGEPNRHCPELNATLVQVIELCAFKRERKYRLTAESVPGEVSRPQFTAPGSGRYFSHY